LQALFQSAHHLYEKKEGSGSGAGFVPLTKIRILEAQKNADPRIRIPKSGGLHSTVPTFPVSLRIIFFSSSFGAKFPYFNMRNKQNCSRKLYRITSIEHMFQNYFRSDKCADPDPFFNLQTLGTLIDLSTCTVCCTTVQYICAVYKFFLPRIFPSLFLMLFPMKFVFFTQIKIRFSVPVICRISVIQG
jgi:hypothetical protein